MIAFTTFVDVLIGWETIFPKCKQFLTLDIFFHIKPTQVTVEEWQTKALPFLFQLVISESKKG